MLRLILVAGGLAVCGWASAQISIPALDTTVTEDFDSMDTAAAALLPSGWKVDSTPATRTTNYYGAGLGTFTTQQSYSQVGAAPTAGGVYNWGAGDSTTLERALGWLGSSTFNSPRQIMVQVVNNTSSTITRLTVSFNYEKYRTGTRAWNLTFFGGTNGSTWSALTAGNNSWPADADSTTMIDPPQSTPKTVVIDGVVIPDGGSYYLRWNYSGVSGSDAQGIAIDDVSVIGTFVSWSVSPTSVRFLDGGKNTVDQANGPFDAGTTVSFYGTTQLAEPSVSAPFSLLNPPSDFSATYESGSSLVLQFRYTPTANSNTLETQTLTIGATTGIPTSGTVGLSARTVKEVPLPVFRNEAETTSAGSIVYKIGGLIVASNKVNTPANILALQDRADGSSATRGLAIYDTGAIGKGAGNLPAVGSQLTVYGTYTNYRGLVELVPDRPYIESPSGIAITPVELPNGAALNDSTEGVLVSIPSVDIPTTNTTKGMPFFGTDAELNTIRFYQETTNPDPPFISYGGARTVTALGWQYSPIGSPNSGGDGYELMVNNVDGLPVTVSRFRLE